MAEREAVREQRGYLSKRVALMQYPAYQQAGWPIGSGMVESANKVVQLSYTGDNSNSHEMTVFALIRPHFGEKTRP